MKIFNLDKVYRVVCNSTDTRYGFRHIATLFKNGINIDKAKICYYNRTWERFTFESVLIRVINANFNEVQAKKYIENIKY